jgi:hypothetical protein
VEALPVAAEFEVHAERGQRVDAAEGPELGDRRPEPLVGCEARQALVECALARCEPVDRGDQVGKGELGRRRT